MVAGKGGETGYLRPPPPPPLRKSERDMTTTAGGSHSSRPPPPRDDIHPKSRPLEDLTSDEISLHCDAFSGADVPTSIYEYTPPPRARPPPSLKDLFPLTPSVFVPDREAAYSPQLLHFVLSKPIVLIRNLSNVCGLDLSIYSTRALVQSHPSHPMEIRTQMEQTANENWDPTMSKQIWSCVSSRSSSSIAQYARYQSANFQVRMENSSRSLTFKILFLADHFFRCVLEKLKMFAQTSQGLLAQF